MLRVCAAKMSCAVFVGGVAEESLQLRLRFRFVFANVQDSDVRLPNPSCQKAPFCFEKDILCARAFDSGRDSERRREELKTFESKIEVKVIAPFSVGDGAALNEAKKFESQNLKRVLNEN